MSKAGVGNRHRNHDGENQPQARKHPRRHVTVRVLPPVIPQPKLSDVLVQLNETSLSQLGRDHGTGHLDHKIANALT
jgi:hypothetical protein